GVILGVLAEVTHLPGGGDTLGDLGHLVILHAVEIRLLLIESFPRHRDAVDGHAGHSWIPVPGSQINLAHRPPRCKGGVEAGERGNRAGKQKRKSGRDGSWPTLRLPFAAFGSSHCSRRPVAFNHPSGNG